MVINEDDNIYRLISLDRKIKRELKYDKFIEFKLPKLKMIENIEIILEKNFKVKLIFKDFSMTYFPKGNSLFFNNFKFNNGSKIIDKINSDFNLVSIKTLMENEIKKFGEIKYTVGKYKNKTISEVSKLDYQYLLWSKDNLFKNEKKEKIECFLKHS